MVQRIGILVYQALDFGLPECEEPSLSSDLEQLIERMTGSDVTDASGARSDDEDGERDEGIEDEDAVHDAQARFTLDTLIEECCKHLPASANASTHYKAVCRALVTESIELTTFLETISTNKAVSFNRTHSFLVVYHCFTCRMLKIMPCLGIDMSQGSVKYRKLLLK